MGTPARGQSRTHSQSPTHRRDMLGHPLIPGPPNLHTDLAAPALRCRRDTCPTPAKVPLIRVPHRPRSGVRSPQRLLLPCRRHRQARQLADTSVLFLSRIPYHDPGSVHAWCARALWRCPAPALLPPATLFATSAHHSPTAHLPVSLPSFQRARGRLGPPASITRTPKFTSVGAFARG